MPRAHGSGWGCCSPPLAGGSLAPGSRVRAGRPWWGHIGVLVGKEASLLEDRARLLGGSAAGDDVVAGCGQRPRGVPDTALAAVTSADLVVPCSGEGLMPATTTNLFLLQDLEDPGRTGQLAESDLEALQAVAGWIKAFVVKPHKDLGRAGTVCPFVPGSLECKVLWLAPEQIAGRGGARRRRARQRLPETVPAGPAHRRRRC